MTANHRGLEATLSYKKYTRKFRTVKNFFTGSNLLFPPFSKLRVFAKAVLCFMNSQVVVANLYQEQFRKVEQRQKNNLVVLVALFDTRLQTPRGGAIFSRSYELAWETLEK